MNLCDLVHLLINYINKGQAIVLEWQLCKNFLPFLGIITFYLLRLQLCIQTMCQEKIEKLKQLHVLTENLHFKKSIYLVNTVLTYTNRLHVMHICQS